MAETEKNSISRLRILYVYKILYENTDEDHKITMPELIELLGKNGIPSSRKGIYDDIEALQKFGVDIITGRGYNSGYCIASREFQLPELKLLADEVSSSKFLTEKKSRELIQKLSTLASKYEAKQMQRQIYVANRVKTMNEQIYLNVDALQRAIAEKKKVSFSYFDYDVNGKKKYRDGKRSCSPYALTYSNEQYYLISRYDKRPEVLTNFRVDRMDSVQLIDDKYIPIGADFDLADYLKQSFQMFSGHASKVKLRFENELVNAVIDRFGKNVDMTAYDDDHFICTVEVNADQPIPFFSWLFLFSTKAEILEPLELRKQYIDILKAIADKQNRID